MEISQKMGIKSPLQPTYSLALGAWEVNLLELTNGYIKRLMVSVAFAIAREIWSMKLILLLKRQ